MGLHIAVCHLVACDATEGLATLRAHAKEQELTVLIFYRVVTAALWEDAILVCEGSQSRLDAFIEMLRGCCEPVIRGASTLMRQWSYTAQELHLPCERVGWGYQNWVDFAAEELREHAQQPQRSPPTSPPPADAERLLGPTGLRGAKYTDYDELTASRLERLGLGCNWSDVLLAAQLSSAASHRVSAAGPPADRKRKGKRPGGGGGGAAEDSPAAAHGAAAETRAGQSEHGARDREVQLASERLARAEL